MIYFNNSATSYPKPKNVLKKINSELKKPLLYNRGNQITYIEKSIFELRQNIGSLISAKKAHYIIFSFNATLALNTLILSFCKKNLKAGDTIITSSMEHNSVYFILKELSKQGINIIYTPYKNNDLDYTFISDRIKENPTIKLAIFTHASNVLGDVFNLEKISSYLNNTNIKFFVDASQTIGTVPIDVEKYNIDGLIFTGHKALMGIQGTGGFYLRKGIELEPILFGSNGHNSTENEEIIYPDSFEIGTPNTIGLLSLNESIKSILDISVEKINQKEKKKAIYLYNELKKVPNIIVYGNEKKELPIVSFNIKNENSLEISNKLSYNNIICRAGYHCSDLAHQQIQTTELGGTVRVSLGDKNTKKEIDIFIDCLIRIATNKK